MFEKITDVPIAIRDFYQEVTKTEPLLDAEGNQVLEPKDVPSFDDQGNEITVTIQVPVFHDVVYVELKSRPETKTLDDVWRIANLHKGMRDDLIIMFFNMYNDGTKWIYHDNYLCWHNAGIQLSESLEQLKLMPPDDTAAYEVKADYQVAIDNLTLSITNHQTNEPQTPVIQSADYWMGSNYSALRELAYPSKEKQLEMQYDDKIKKTNHWVESLQVVKEQYPKLTKD